MGMSLVKVVSHRHPDFGLDLHPLAISRYESSDDQEGSHWMISRGMIPGVFLSAAISKNGKSVAISGCGEWDRRQPGSASPFAASIRSWGGHPGSKWMVIGHGFAINVNIQTKQHKGVNTYVFLNKSG